MAIDRTRLLATVHGLDLPDGEYAVFGSGPLVVRDLRTGADIDLVVTAALYQRLRDEGWSAQHTDDGTRKLRRGDVEAIASLDVAGYRTDVTDLVAAAERIDDVPFVPLGELREFKAAVGRPKDHVDLDLIDQALEQERRGAPSAERIAAAREVLAGRDIPPPAAEIEPWHGTGWRFVAGTVTRPAATFTAARGTSCWGAGFAVMLVLTTLACVAVPVRGGSAWWLAAAPPAAGLGLVISTLMGRLALDAARRAGGDGRLAAVSSQTAIVFGLCSFPFGVAAVVAAEPVPTYVWLATLPLVLGMLALLYARSLRVSFARGLAGAASGYLGGVAALILVGFVAVLIGTLLSPG